MNFKTTLILFFAVVVLGVVIFFLQEKAPPPKPTIATTPTMPNQAAEQDLVESDFGDAVDIVANVEGQPEWHFVREDSDDAGPGEWRMTAPFEAKVQRWQVDQIARRITTAKYAVKFKAGESGGISAQDAGLDPPRATVKMVNADDKMIEVRIGRNEGNQETYVQLAGDDAIYRVKPSLKGVLKDSALEYREQQLVSVKPNDIVRLTITERPEGGQPITYELVKTGTNWMFEKPARTRAVNDKIRDLASTFSTLRVAKWVQADVKDLAMYGLDSAAVTVTATAEEIPQDAAPKDAGTNGEEAPEPAPVTREYTVHFSDVTPLDDKNKVYVRADGENCVGTIVNATADKFKPDMQAWRESSIIERNAQTAREVEITKEGQTTELTRAGMSWSFADTNEPADQVEVDRYLKSINDIKALNFEDGAADDPARFGLDNPQGTVLLSFDQDEKVTLTVGGYADPDTQRLVFVQTNNADSVAKLRVGDAEKLLRDPADFRDRQVIDVDAVRFEGLTIDRPAADGPDAGRIRIGLTKQDDTWRMTEPVEAAADAGQVDKLINTLASLRAQKVIDAAGNLADYGLDEPAIRVDYTYLPPQIFKMVPKQPAEGEEATTQPAEMVAEPYQPPAETYSLLVSQKDGKTYVARAESPDVVYMLGRGIYDQLTAELRDTSVFSFDAEQVTKVTLTKGESTEGFSKTDTGWEFIPEPDIPIDGAKVTNYLLGINNLKAQRFVEYNATDLAQYGLDAPAYQLTVDVDGAAQPALLVSATMPDTGGPYAKRADSNSIFTLPADAIIRITIDVAEFETAP